METQACKDATSVIALSEIVKEELIARGVEKEKIYIVPNGVNTDKLKPQDLAKWIVGDKLTVRMQLQLHKLIWDKDERRV